MERWNTNQLIKNRAFHSKIQTTANEGLFGCIAKVCLKISNLPQDILQCTDRGRTGKYSNKSVQTILLEETDNR